jgi:hypothetical protein
MIGMPAADLCISKLEVIPQPIGFYNSLQARSDLADPMLLSVDNGTRLA